MQESPQPQPILQPLTPAPVITSEVTQPIQTAPESRMLLFLGMGIAGLLFLFGVTSFAYQQYLATKPISLDSTAMIQPATSATDATTTANLSTSSTDSTVAQDSATPTSETNINSFVESGKSFKCSWTNTTGGFAGNVPMEGTAYIKNGLLYAKVTSEWDKKINSQQLLYDATHRYSWFSEGTIHFVSTRSKHLKSQAAFKQDMVGRHEGDDYTYSCTQVKDEEIDDTLFIKPENITFKDLDNTLETVTTPR